jgi:hypothetical protein
MKIVVPKRINSSRFLPFFSALSEGDASPEIEIDFSNLRRVTPGGLTALVATVVRWRRAHRRVEMLGLRECPIVEYLQRMNVLKACGVDMPENFVRHQSKGRFVPVTLIDVDVTELGRQMAGCLAPGGEDYDHPMAGLYDLSNYVITEIANNTRQHSSGLGYVAAQLTRVEGMVRISLADNGVGILRSLQLVEFPGSDRMSDMDAIQKALEPRVSSKAGDPNEGVGLTLVANLTRLARGWLTIISGTGVVSILRDGRTIVGALPDNGRYQGTFVGGIFPQDTTRDFAQLINQAKLEAGLLPRGTIDAKFER